MGREADARRGVDRDAHVAVSVSSGDHDAARSAGGRRVAGPLAASIARWIASAASSRRAPRRSREVGRRRGRHLAPAAALDRRADQRRLGEQRAYSVAEAVEQPRGALDVLSRKVTWPVGSRRSGCSWALMKPIGMIPCFFAALSRRVRARSRGVLVLEGTWPKRARAFRDVRRVIDRQPPAALRSRCRRRHCRELRPAPSREAAARANVCSSPVRAADG